MICITCEASTGPRLSFVFPRRYCAAASTVGRDVVDSSHACTQLSAYPGIWLAVASSARLKNLMAGSM